nr:hypothetical protein MACL_00003066 [Theileria orientalis]
MFSKYYSYKKDGYTVTYTAKSEYLFTLVKRYSTVLWKAKNSREYSDKVVFDCAMKRIIYYNHVLGYPSLDIIQSV